MANTVFKIIGNQDTGKSSTIRLLFNRLSNQNLAGEINQQLTWNNIRIGLLSHTDPGTENIVSTALQDFIRNNCTIIIISSRTKGLVSEIIDNISSQANYQTIRLQTNVASSFFDENFFENLNNEFSFFIENLIIPTNNF